MLDIENNLTYHWHYQWGQITAATQCPSIHVPVRSMTGYGPVHILSLYYYRDGRRFPSDNMCEIFHQGRYMDRSWKSHQGKPSVFPVRDAAVALPVFVHRIRGAVPRIFLSRVGGRCLYARHNNFLCIGIFLALRNVRFCNLISQERKHFYSVSCPKSSVPGSGEMQMVEPCCTTARRNNI
jgi:hypothetical protein